MTTFRHLAILGLSLAAAPLISAAVPGSINYQGRLTNAAGVPQPGAHAMSLTIYDAATGGTQLYTESLGSITADTNGVYAFQFGAAGASNTQVTETIATTDGATLTYAYSKNGGPASSGRLTPSVNVDIAIDPAWVYKLKLRVSSGGGYIIESRIHDVRITANQ